MKCSTAPSVRENDFGFLFDVELTISKLNFQKVKANLPLHLNFFMILKNVPWAHLRTSFWPWKIYFTFRLVVTQILEIAVWSSMINSNIQMVFKSCNYTHTQWSLIMNITNWHWFDCIYLEERERSFVEFLLSFPPCMYSLRGAQGGRCKYALLSHDLKVACHSEYKHRV